MLRRILDALRPARRAPVSVQDQLRRARMHFHAAEYDEALTQFAQAVQAAPADTAAWLELALTQEKLGHRLEAVRSCARAYVLDAEAPAAIQAGIRLSDALVESDAWPDDDCEPDFASELARANGKLATGDFTHARKHLERALVVQPEWPAIHQRLGSIAAHSGALDDASLHFEKSGALGVPPDAYIRLDTDFLCSLDPANFAPAEPVAPMTTHEFPAGQAAAVQMVVLLACDAVYFRRFAYPLLKSLRDHGGVPILVHLHLFNPDPWIAEELRELPVGGYLAGLETSSERCGFDSHDAAKTHYSSARLYLVPCLLARHGHPVAMLDMDVLVLKSLAPLVCLGNTADVALLRWPTTNWRIWDHVYASTVVFQPTSGGMRFAAMAAAYVRAFIARPGGAWYLDQIALFASYAHLQRRGVGFAAIPVNWYALFGACGEAVADSTVFWSVTANIVANADALSTRLFRVHLPVVRKAFSWTLPGSDSFFPQALACMPIEDGRPRWDLGLMQACTARLARHRRAIDIGSHVGFWSDWLASRFARVDSFEPYPLHQACFAANVAHANVTLHRCGLGERTASVSMVADPDNSGMTHVDPDRSGDVPIRTLDEFDFDDVDFIKIDAEGFEAAVLRGAERTLVRCRPLILLEEIAPYPERYGETADAARQLLLTAGARLIAELPDRNNLYGWPDEIK